MKRELETQINHQFLVLPEPPDGDYSGYYHALPAPDSLRLDCPVVEFMWHTLNWIPTIDPKQQEKGQRHGLIEYGATVINQTGARTATIIFRSWAAMLQQGPEQLFLPNLSGVFVRTPREPAVVALWKLVEYAEKVETGDFYILHVGP